MWRRPRLLKLSPPRHLASPQSGGSVLEIHSIVALVVYALVNWLLARLAWLVFGETRSAVATTTSSIETRG